jgi:hypothetical protein
MKIPSYNGVLSPGAQPLKTGVQRVENFEMHFPWAGDVLIWVCN